MQESDHQAGFVNIVGQPNVGKSTLINALVGERLSIITSKAQTTRHRILGIHNSDDFQIIYSDTPGILTPAYALHKSMIREVHTALIDADILLWMVDIRNQEVDPDFLKRLQQAEVPLFLLLNKIDLVQKEKLPALIVAWEEKIKATQIIPIAAAHKTNVMLVFKLILDYLPKHPAYYPKDTLTDKPVRFFAAEIIREKILSFYRQEIPYSTEVVITEFKEEPTIIRLRAEIYVERTSQKYILIGKGGSSLKKVGIAAREDMERFFNKKVFLEQFVKVAPDWRKKPAFLNRFGYH